MPDGPVVALIFLLVGGALVLLYFFVEHRRHGRGRHRAREAERIPLFGTDMLATRAEDGSVHPASDADPSAPRPVRRTPSVPRPAFDVPPAFAGVGARRPGNGVADGDQSFAPPRSPVDRGRAPAVAPSGFASASAARAAQTPGPAAGFAPVHATAGALAADPGEGALVSGETLRFAVADEGTLRFLPGRLEVSAGPDAGREVRFVAPPGGSEGPVEVTFGRTEGPAYRHVQLLARTVSRRHARMQLTDDHWSLQNLSATNPVILNGRPLAADEVAPLLVDGDRIEMGEVVFVFHAR